MTYDFDEIIDRRHTNSAKFDEMDALFGSDVMHLGVADMDYRSPEPILNAMQKIVKKGVEAIRLPHLEYLKHSINNVVSTITRSISLTDPQKPFRV